MSKVNLLRLQARERGDKLYMPDAPCSKGHTAMRRVDNGSCVECLSENNKRFVSENTASINARRRQHRAENKELYELKKQSPGFIQNVKRQIERRTKSGHAAFVRMTDRMKKLCRLTNWDQEFTEFVCKEAHHLARLRDKCTGQKWSVDHIAPIKGRNVSGLHVWYNLQVIPMRQNRLKHNFFGD